MLQSKLVSHVYGSNSLLLFHCPQVITKIDFDAANYTLVEYKAVLQAVAMSQGQMQGPSAQAPQHFVDACILAGWDTFSTTFQPIHAQPNVFRLPDVFRAVHQADGGFRLLQYYSTQPVNPPVDQKTIEAFLKVDTPSKPP